MSIPLATPALWVLVAVVKDCPGIPDPPPCAVGITSFFTEKQCIEAMPAWNRYRRSLNETFLLHCVYNWTPHVESARVR